MPILLHQPPGRAWGMPNLSPFCTKLESYLRMRGLAYELRPGNPREAPKGKVPYITLEDGTRMGDSQLIIERLERDRPPGLDAKLDDAQRAQGHLLRRTLEDGTYFIGVWQRWVTDEGWAVNRKEFLKFVPPGIGGLILAMIRRQVVKGAHAQGTSRHSRDEIAALARADFLAASRVLGDKSYLFGEEPTTYDASLFALSEAALKFPLDDGVLRASASACENIVAHNARVRARYFTDLEPPKLAATAPRNDVTAGVAASP